MGHNWPACWMAMWMCAVVGCSGGSSTEPQGPALPSDPAARSAYEFFDAVLHGDTARASSQLTPLAIERIIERGEQFAPPGDDSAVGFRIGQVVRPNPTEALVQCILTESAANHQRQNTEVYCLLRLVDGGWRVSGIAHTAGPKHTPMILDFETGQHVPVPQQPVADQSGQQTVPRVAGRSSGAQSAPEGPGSSLQ